MTDPSTCPLCGAPLAQGGRSGRCPACLLQAALGPDSTLHVTPGEGGAAQPYPALSEQPGTRIGHYKLLEQIGDGGFGVVWMAEQEEPACRDCVLRPRCNNSCGCLNRQTTGSVNAISPTLCRHEQMLMPITDRLGRELYRQRDPHFLHKHYHAAYPVLSMIEDSLSARGKD